MNDETTRPLPDGSDEPTRALTPDESIAEEPAPGGPPPTDDDPGRAPQEPWQSPQEPWQPLYDEEGAGGRHPLSVAHLVAGLVFLGVAVSWLLRETGVVDAEATGWFMPLTLVVAGAIGLVAWLGSARAKSR